MDVLILMGSDSDAAVMSAAGEALTEFGLTWEMTVASAHRSPARVMRLVDEAPGRGVKVFIVGAGAVPFQVSGLDDIAVLAAASR